MKRAAQCIRQHVWVSIFFATYVRNIFPSDEHVTNYAENEHTNPCIVGSMQTVLLLLSDFHGKLKSDEKFFVILL